jgi:hypothetical protein
MTQLNENSNYYYVTGVTIIIIITISLLLQHPVMISAAFNMLTYHLACK